MSAPGGGCTATHLAVRPPVNLTKAEIEKAENRNQDVTNPDPTIEGQRFVTPARLAVIMDVSDSTVEEWVRRRLLPSFKVGRVRRFAMADVLAFIKAYTVSRMPANWKRLELDRLPANTEQALWERIERLIDTRLGRPEQQPQPQEEAA